jgi:serine/threonine-protein kinase
LVTDARLLALRDSLPGRALRGSGRVTYHLRQRIGEGGQGWVFTAGWDDPHGLVVVVKVLRPDSVSEDTYRRFEREAAVLRMLSQQPTPNPHVVRFYDHAVARVANPATGDTHSLPFTVLEYVAGQTLEQVLAQQRGRGLPIARVRRIIKQVAQALDLVHEQKVVHRDLKPSNILLSVDTGTEIAKVTDFGLVKLVDVALTRTATLAGASLGYAPPEQYEQGNRRVGRATDVFSLAAIVHEMLSGQVAFPFRDDENPLLVVTRILNGARPRLEAALAALPDELRARLDVVRALDVLLGRSLSPDPEDRPQTVRAFWEEVDALLASVTAGVPSRPPRDARAFGFGETSPAMSRLPGHPMSVEGGVVRPSYASIGSRPPSSDATSPAQWTWRVVTAPVRPGLLRAAIFHADGSAVGIGPSGLGLHAAESWSAVAVPAGLAVERVRAALPWADREVVLVGDAGLAALFLHTTGRIVFLPVADPEATLHGGHGLASTDELCLVGTRPARPGARTTTATSGVGFVVQYVRGAVTSRIEVASTGRLDAVARVSGSLVAVGERGALVRVEGATAVHAGTLCGGHLHAIAALGDGSAVTVGAGGHALHIDPQLHATLEAVQTTRSLHCLGVGVDGTAWAGSAQARLLRRTGDSWLRMSTDLGLASTVVAVWVSELRIRAICDDGAVVEGRAR